MSDGGLHARWWSGSVREWFDGRRKVDVDNTGVRHRIIVSGILKS